MTHRRKRTWWTHGPAVILLAGFIVWFLLKYDQWPSRIPLQIDWAGEPTRWGSPWIACLVVTALGVFFLAISALIDSLWAKQESRKRFNLLSLLDELVLALLVAVQGSFLTTAASGRMMVGVSWSWLLLLVGAGLLSGIVVERLRPFSGPAAPSPEATDLNGFREYLLAQVARGERVAYWDVQNPRYVTWLTVGAPIVFWITAGFLARSDVWAGLIFGVVGLALLQFYGGFRTHVSREGITIRCGLAGVRVFRCRLSEITEIGVRSFAPLADFGGYGIRIAGGVVAYYLTGRTGVRMNLAERRSVLIGATHPERLAAVIGVLAGMTVHNEVT